MSKDVCRYMQCYYNVNGSCGITRHRIDSEKPVQIPIFCPYKVSE